MKHENIVLLMLCCQFTSIPFNIKASELMGYKMAARFALLSGLCLSVAAQTQCGGAIFPTGAAEDVITAPPGCTIQSSNANGNIKVFGGPQIDFLKFQGGFAGNIEIENVDFQPEAINPQPNVKAATTILRNTIVSDTVKLANHSGSIFALGLSARKIELKDGDMLSIFSFFPPSPRITESVKVERVNGFSFTKNAVPLSEVSVKDVNGRVNIRNIQVAKIQVELVDGTTTNLSGETTALLNVTATDVVIKDVVGKGIPLVIQDSAIDKLDCSSITSGPVLCTRNQIREATGPCNVCQT